MRFVLIAAVLAVVLLFGCAMKPGYGIWNPNSPDSNESQPEVISCKDLVSNLLPHYFAYSGTDVGAVYNPIIRLRNGESINIVDKDMGCPLITAFGGDPCFRHGSQDGENVNLIYYSPGDKGLNCVCPSDGFSYSKQITAPDGTILGYRTFSLIPSPLKKYNASYNIEFFNDGWEIRWHGFDKDVLEEAFNTSEINFKFYTTDGIRDGLVCDFTTNEASGKYFCNYTSWIKTENLHFAGIYRVDALGSCKRGIGITMPCKDLNDIYEITSVVITACHWVTDDGQVIN